MSTAFILHTDLENPFDFVDSPTNANVMKYETLKKITRDNGLDWLECVRICVRGIRFQMWVDDCGLMKDLPLNPLASALYGNVIVGNAIITADRSDPNTYWCDEFESMFLHETLSHLTMQLR